MKKILLIINLLFTSYLISQNATDIFETYGEFSGIEGYMRNALQPDGKILLGGFKGYGSYNENQLNNLIRINVDGRIDNTFNLIGSGFTISNTTNIPFISSITVQQDGKIIVFGDFTHYNGISRNRILRLNSDCTLDTTFNIGSGFNDTTTGTSSLALLNIQTDGKILVTGDFSSFNGVNFNSSLGMVRLNTNGTLDSTFNIGLGFFGGGVSKVALQTDGKLLVCGAFTSFNGVTFNRLLRLNTDGSIDSSFIIGNIGFNSFVNDIGIQADGKIILTGSFDSFNGIVQNRLIRLNPNGTKDVTFDIGTGFSDRTDILIIQSDGKIIIVGKFTSFNGLPQNRIIRLNTDGTIDNSFLIGSGFNFNTTIPDFDMLYKQPDNKILISGNFSSYNGVFQNGFVKILNNGSEDENYLLGNPGFKDVISSSTSSYYPGISCIKLQTDGKLLVGGSFTTFNGIAENKLMRFNSDGKKDLSFNIINGFNQGTISSAVQVSAIAVQTDGKILVGGNFTTFNNLTENRIIRLNSNGTKDNTFNVGTGFDNTVYQILIQPDGKILVLGHFTSFNGVAKNKFIRLNQNGSIDNSFFSFPNLNVPIIGLQPDGKILMGNFNGNLKRLNSDGTDDLSFNVGTGLNNTIRKIVVQADGKILVGGSFTTYNGLSQKALIRFNSDGTKDLTFNAGGTGIGSGRVYDIAIQSDGKIIICGANDYNGIFQNGLIRLNPNGSLDPSFIFGDTSTSNAFPSYPPDNIQIRDNGVILVSGRFLSYFNYPSSGLLGIRGNSILSNVSFEGNYYNNITLFPNPLNNILNFSYNDSDKVSEILVYDLTGQLVLKSVKIEDNSLNVSDLSKGIYIVKIKTSDNKTFTKKVIKN
jgi:uncharacterized delta-60 repeat protein